MNNNNALLSIQGVQKRFDGLQAPSDVSLEIREGEIYSLIGPNSTDKTMFFNVVTGLYMPDADGFVLDGMSYQPTAVHEVAEAGIVCIFQDIHLLDDMTAAENVMVGRHVRVEAGLIGAVFRIETTREGEQSVEDWAHDLPGYVGIDKYANYTACNLSYDHQRRLEVAHALATQPELLALDEPAAGMDAAEKVELRGLFDEIRSDNKTILLIEHDVKPVMGLCNHLIVLDYGKVTVQGLPHEAQSNPAVIGAYPDALAH